MPFRARQAMPAGAPHKCEMPGGSGWWIGWEKIHIIYIIYIYILACSDTNNLYSSREDWNMMKYVCKTYCIILHLCFVFIFNAQFVLKLYLTIWLIWWRHSGNRPLRLEISHGSGGKWPLQPTRTADAPPAPPTRAWNGADSSNFDPPVSSNMASWEIPELNELIWVINGGVDVFICGEIIYTCMINERFSGTPRLMTPEGKRVTTPKKKHGHVNSWTIQ